MFHNFICRSSHKRCSVKKGSEKFSKIYRKTHVPGLQLYQKADSGTGFAKIFRTPFL